MLKASPSINYVPSSSSEPYVSEVMSETVKPPMSEVVKPIEVLPSRKIRVDLKESKPKESWVCHFLGKYGHIHPNCYKL